MTDADTRMLATSIRDDFPARRFTPSPTQRAAGNRRRHWVCPNHAMRRQHGFKVKAPKAPWAIRDKYATVRFMLKDAHNRRRLLIDPSCKRLIRSIASLEYAPGKSVADPRQRTRPRHRRTGLPLPGCSQRHCCPIQSVKSPSSCTACDAAAAP